MEITVDQACVIHAALAYYARAIANDEIAGVNRVFRITHVDDVREEVSAFLVENDIIH